MDGTKSRILFGNPVQRIKRNHEIKRLLERQTASVCHLKSKVGPRRRTEVALCEANHVPRRIDPDHRTSRDARGDFCGDLSVAASDIKDSLRVLKIEQSEYFLSHRSLERRAAIVLSSIPFCQMR